MIKKNKCIKGFCQWVLEDVYEINDHLEIDFVCPCCGKRGIGRIKIYGGYEKYNESKN